MADGTDNQEVVAAILTSAILRGNPKPHTKIAVDTYKIVLDSLRAESRPKPAAAAEPGVAEPTPEPVAAATDAG